MILSLYEPFLQFWESPSVGERLACEREPGNAHDTHAVAIKKVISGEIKIVGHIPKRFLQYVPYSLDVVAMLCAR